MNLALAPGLAESFMVAFARVGALVMLMPGIGERAIPMRQRLVLALALTLIVLPMVREITLARGMALPRMLGEALLGLSIGLAGRIAMAALDIAGGLIAQSIGLSMAQVLDPAQGQQGETLSVFLRMLGVSLIFAGDLHHLALAGIVGSYELLPVGTSLPQGDLAELVLKLVRDVFETGLRIAAPFVVFGLVFNVGLGLAARLTPQVQLFFLAMPVALIIGLAILMPALGMGMGQFLALVRSAVSLLTPGG